MDLNSLFGRKKAFSLSLEKKKRGSEVKVFVFKVFQIVGKLKFRNLTFEGELDACGE